jgi:hypothetical protein
MKPETGSRWEKAFDMAIEPSEIIDLVEEMTELHDNSEEIDWYSSMGVLFNRYSGTEDCADRVFCISTRMSCLSDLMKSDDERLHCWAKIANDPKCIVTHSALFHATALCKLNWDEKRTWFDPDEFFNIALEQAESEGNA